MIIDRLGIDAGRRRPRRQIVQLLFDRRQPRAQIRDASCPPGNAPNSQNSSATSRPSQPAMPATSQRRPAHRQMAALGRWLIRRRQCRPAETADRARRLRPDGGCGCVGSRQCGRLGRTCWPASSDGGVGLWRPDRLAARLGRLRRGGLRWNFGRRQVDHGRRPPPSRAWGARRTLFIRHAGHSKRFDQGFGMTKASRLASSGCAATGCARRPRAAAARRPAPTGSNAWA